jgi:hypothetical protein
MSRSPRQRSGWAFLDEIGRAVAGPSLAGILLLAGCAPSGVGSVDWADSPNARAVGAPPRLPQKPAQPPRKTSKKTLEFMPG